MADILDSAINFAKEIQKTKEYLKLEEAKKNNDNDEELVRMITEYNNLTEKVKNLISTKNSQKEEIDKTNDEISIIYKKIMENKNMIDYDLASSEMNILMNKINSILIDAVNGKKIDSCSKNKVFNCGSCRKCSGKK